MSTVWTPKLNLRALVQWSSKFSIVYAILVCAIGASAVLAVPTTGLSMDQALRLSYIRDGVTYSMDLTTGSTEALGTLEDTFYAPPVSPNGRWMAEWEMNGSGLAQIVIYDAVTLEPAYRYPLFSTGSRLSWSTDSEALLLTATGTDAASNMSDLWLMNRETGTMTRLTYTPQLELDPVFSPDGSKIAYIVVEDSGDHRLYVMDLASQTTRTLTTDYNADRPAWSPDGQWIAFEATQNGPSSQIAIVRPDSTDLRVVTDGTAYDFTPTWR